MPHSAAGRRNGPFLHEALDKVRRGMRAYKYRREMFGSAIRTEDNNSLWCGGGSPRSVRHAPSHTVYLIPKSTKVYPARGMPVFPRLFVA